MSWLAGLVVLLHACILQCCSNGRARLPKQKNMSTLTSDDAVTCQNILGSPSVNFEVWLKFKTKTVCMEEGDPEDEAVGKQAISI